MKLPSISSINFSNFFKNVKGIGRDDYIYWGVTSMAILLVLLIGWAVYVFATTASGEKAGIVASVRSISLKETDVKEVIELLDEREKKFKEVLSGQ